MKFMRSIKCALCLLIVITCATRVCANTEAQTQTVTMTPLERAQQMLESMTLADKLRMMRGCRGDYVGNIEGNRRLGIPSLNMQVKTFMSISLLQNAASNHVIERHNHVMSNRHVIIRGHVTEVNQNLARRARTNVPVDLKGFLKRGQPSRRRKYCMS